MRSRRAGAGNSPLESLAYMEDTRGAPPRPWRSVARAAKAATLAMLVAALASTLHLNASVTQPPLPAASRSRQQPDPNKVDALYRPLPEKGRQPI